MGATKGNMSVNFNQNLNHFIIKKLSNFRSKV